MRRKPAIEKSIPEKAVWRPEMRKPGDLPE